MSLVGNLEDLSLPDILQIVSLSKKSGILMLEREGQQGKIIIRKGKVIQTVSPRTGRTLGEILTGRGIVRPEDLKKALEIQRAGGNRDLLGGILVQLKLVDLATLEKVVQEQIEEAIIFFLTWREGTFSFELADVQGRGEFSIDPQAFILEHGIDTQWLVLEGTRVIDERKRGGAAPPDAGTPADDETSFADVEAAAEEPRPLVLVDDDDVFRSLAAEGLGRLGFRVVPCGGVAEGLAAAADAARRPGAALVADIVMPTLDNQGFLGGLELIERVRASHPAVAVAAVTAYPDENVKAKVAALGGSFFLKPTGGAGGEGALASFLGQVAAALEAATAAAPPPPVPRPRPPEPAPPPAPATPAPAPRPQPPPPAAKAAPPPPKPAASPAVAAPAAHAAAKAPAPPPPATAAAPVKSEQEAALEDLKETLTAIAEGRGPAPEVPVRGIAAVPPVPAPAVAPPPVAPPAAGGAPGEVIVEPEPMDTAALLREMLDELRRPQATNELGLLTLRFASEVMSRAVLFMVKGGSLVGLGGFGLDVAGPGRSVRGYTLPLGEPSALEQAVRTRAPVRGPLAPTAVNRALVERLGGRTPAEAVALPLVAGGKARVVLYGDNLPGGGPLDGVDALERFLAEAGRALETALAGRRAHAPGEAPGPGGQQAGGAKR